MKQNTIRRFISLAMLFVLVILFSATSDYFLQAKNIISIFRDASVIGIVGIGVTYVIITGVLPPRIHSHPVHLKYIQGPYLCDCH